MALVHQFAIIPKDSNEKFISADMDIIEISDNLIQYLEDSLQWIYSKWNGKEMKSGISYYGFSIIESGEIEKLIKIIEQWKRLFELAPTEFFITGEFLPEENKYKKIYIKKEDMLRTLSSWIVLCKTAIKKDYKILHNGI